MRTALLFITLLTTLTITTNAVDLSQRRHTSIAFVETKEKQTTRKKLTHQKSAGHASDLLEQASAGKPAPKETSSADRVAKATAAVNMAAAAAAAKAGAAPDPSSPPIDIIPDARGSDLNAVNDAIKHPAKFSASKIRAMMKQRKELTQEMINGSPDPSSDVKFEQAIPGVDRIGAGFDASDGSLKLPTLVWKKYTDDPCGPGKTGRWCNIATMDNQFFKNQLPSAIAVTKETESHSSVVRRVYSDTKELSSEESTSMSFRSPVGVLTQEQDVEMLREVQAHSDLMLARREQRLYTLKLYPFQSQAVDTAFIKSELLESFLGSDYAGKIEEKGEKEEKEEEEVEEEEHGAAGSVFLPDCVLHDCMIRDERDDMPSVGCQFDGMRVPVPSCDDLSKKGQETLKKECDTRFFLKGNEKLMSKTYKLTEICKDSTATEAARKAGPSAAKCRAHGVDLGTICNAHDLGRLGKFVARWGTHFVESASFGGEMEVSVQMRKDRMRTGMAGTTVGDQDFRDATDHGRRTARRTALPSSASTSASASASASDEMSADAVIDEGHAAAVLEPQDSTTLASSGGGGERVETDRRSSINSVLDAMFASGVELGQDVRRARLSSGGIENIAISFVGGTDMPATESSVTRKEISDWSKTIGASPALLKRTMTLRPLFELMDHPSVYDAITRRAKFTRKNSEMKEKDMKKKKLFIKSMKKSLARKKILLENHLRWYLAKSEALGTALDRSSAARVKAEHELQAMGRTVQDWVEAVLHDDTSRQRSSLDTVLRDESISLRGRITNARSDQIKSTEEDEKSQKMLSYIMQYRRSQERFDKLCKVKCERDGDVVELKNLMCVFLFTVIFCYENIMFSIFFRGLVSESCHSNSVVLLFYFSLSFFFLLFFFPPHLLHYNLY